MYRSTVGDISVNCRWYISQLSVVYRSTVGGISVNCRSNISRVLIYQVSPMAFFLSKDVINYCYRPLYRPSVDWVSTEYRPTVDRVSIDYRPSVDRLSTECRPLYRPLYCPLYRPISQSTLPTVNKMRYFQWIINSVPEFGIHLIHILDHPN